MYLRLYLDELIKGDYEKVLCLDADTFVDRSVIDLLSKRALFTGSAPMTADRQETSSSGSAIGPDPSPRF